MAVTGTMAEMNQSGDTKVSWDKHDSEEVEVARAAFDKLTKKGKYVAFNVSPGGRKAGRMHEFDADAQEIILVPAIAGG